MAVFCIEKAWKENQGIKSMVTKERNTVQVRAEERKKGMRVQGRYSTMGKIKLTSTLFKLWLPK